MSDYQLQLVTFEQAVRLKKAGFDWFQPNIYNKDGTLADYDDWADMRYDCYAPTVALALKWARDTKTVVYDIRRNTLGHSYWASFGYDGFWMSKPECAICGKTYEDIESALLDESLEAIEKGWAGYKGKENRQ